MATVLRLDFPARLSLFFLSERPIFLSSELARGYRYVSEHHIQEFTIEGMSCTGCSSRIEKALTQTAGIDRAVVHFASRTAVVASSLSDAEVEKIISRTGYRASALVNALVRQEREKQEQKKAMVRVIAAVALTLPVVVIGMSHSLMQSDVLRWSSAFLTALLLVWPGSVFFKKAFSLMLLRTANMDTLVALGAGLSFLWSVYQSLSGGEHVYFETAAAIICFVLVGKFIEHRMSWRATSSLGALVSLQPRLAKRIAGAPQAGELEEIDSRFIRVGDFLQARIGERFAADGVVLEGTTEVDESLLTGESLPVNKKAGEAVAAGSLNLSAPVMYRAEKVGHQSRLGEIVAFVERTQLSKAPIQRLADKVSAVFVPFILILSVVTFLIWFLLLRSDAMSAINAAVSVMVVACPCALGLATPIAIAIATTRAARLGILFRDIAALESLRSVTMLVIDKTGTLTSGKIKVAHEHLFQQGHVPECLFAAVAQLEQVSQHPVATALCEWISNKSKSNKDFTLHARREVVGQGVSAELDWGGQIQTLSVGPASEDELKLLPEWSSGSWVVCRLNDVAQVAFALSDSLRPESKQVVQQLRTLGINPVVASGDRAPSVASIAQELGLQFHAEQNPRMKSELIAKAQREGQRVAMLGDGVNDAPALAQSDVGIAMGGGTDAAQETAALTLRTSTLAGVLTAFELSRVTFRNIRQNLFWAFAYNVILLPLAMAGKLTPMWAAAAMAFSSLFVVLNSLRLLRFAGPEPK